MAAGDATPEHPVSPEPAAALPPPDSPQPPAVPALPAEAGEPLGGQLRFLLEADRLKTVLRQSLITGGSRQENSAEHSWHLALMALVLAGYAPPGTDLAKVTAMLLIHDLVEIDAGDLFLYADADEHARQEAAERAAARRLFALLPGPQGEALRALWEEFEKRATPEAKFARALDRLEPMLLNTVTGGGTWRIHAVSKDQVLPKLALIEDGSPALGAFSRDLIEAAVEQGLLAPAPDPEPPHPGTNGS